MNKIDKQGFNPLSSIRNHLLACVALTVLVLGVVGGSAATMVIAGAVIADGQLVVDSNVKKVQHPVGGIVGEVLVRNGDYVKTGDVILRLDETQTKANLAIVTKNLADLWRGRRARKPSATV